MVIIIIGILIAITTVTYTSYQDRAVDSQARSIANAVKAGSERYFTKNNEYPSAQTLYGDTPDGSTPSSYQAASDAIDVATSVLDNTKVKFLPCAGGSCTFTDTEKVYYLTKPDANPTSQQQYTISGCTFTFPAADTGSASYVMAYWNQKESQWIYNRSNNGSVTTSSTTSCPFSSS